MVLQLGRTSSACARSILACFNSHQFDLWIASWSIPQTWGQYVIIFVVLVIIAFVTGVASPSLLSTVFSLGYSNVKVLINDFSVLVPFEGLFFFIGLALGFLKAPAFSLRLFNANTLTPVTIPIVMRVTMSNPLA